jgi:hypothetical protein
MADHMYNCGRNEYNYWKECLYCFESGLYPVL